MSEQRRSSWSRTRRWPASELIDAVRRRRAGGDALVTVIAPVNAPREGYVVYEDTRRAAAGRRLERTLDQLHDAGIPAHGHVVDTDPLAAVRDAIAMERARRDDRLHASGGKSGWLRRDLVDRDPQGGRRSSGRARGLDVAARTGAQNVLVIANETVLGAPLLDADPREGARRRRRTSFLIVSPQSDPEQGEHPEAERRLRRAVAQLRAEGIDAHGQVAHPDPFTAAMDAVHDERVDEIIVSTFPGRRLALAAPRPDRAARERDEAAGRARRRRAEPSEVGA